MEEGAQIVVNNGTILSFNGCSIVGSPTCTRLWRRIRSNSGATVNFATSTVKDAEIGIESNNGGVFNITNSIFDLNVVHCQINQFFSATDFPGAITGSTFTCTNCPDQPGPTPLRPFCTLPSNFVAQPWRTRVGITVDYFGQAGGGYINIGNGTSSTNKNYFSNCDYGLWILRTNVRVFNNRFENINVPNMFPNPPLSLAHTQNTIPTAIVLRGIDGSVQRTFIGNNTLFNKNEFVACANGIQSNWPNHLNIDGNVFDGLDGCGIFAVRASLTTPLALNTVVFIEDNTFKNVGNNVPSAITNSLSAVVTAPNDVIRIANTEASIVTIQSNNFEIPDPNYTNGTGILLTNPSIYTNANLKFYVLQNFIIDKRNGIMFDAILDPIADGNVIRLLSGPTDIASQSTRGIILQSSQEGEIQFNDIQATNLLFNPLNVNVQNGIWVNGGNGNHLIACNTTTNLGVHIRYQSGNPSSNNYTTLPPLSGILGNKMINGAQGISLRNGFGSILGPQPYPSLNNDPTYPMARSDNEWFGGWLMGTNHGAINNNGGFLGGFTPMETGFWVAIGSLFKDPSLTSSGITGTPLIPILNTTNAYKCPIQYNRLSFDSLLIELENQDGSGGNRTSLEEKGGFTDFHLNILRKSTNYQEATEAAKLAWDYCVFKMIESNPALKDTNPEIDSLFNLVENNTIKLLIEAESALNSGQSSLSIDLLNQIAVSTTSPLAYYKEILQILVNYADSVETTFSNADLDQLNYIASLCPDSAGIAVLFAKRMLGVNSESNECIENSEGQNRSGQIKNSNSISLLLNGNTIRVSNTSLAGTLKLFTIQGTFLQEFSLPQTAPILVDDFPKGIIIYQILDEKQEIVSHGKLILFN